MNTRVPAMPPESELDDEAFGRSLEHAKVGYSNAQDIIKFIDTKSGVITGLVTVLLGLLFLIVQWLAERDRDSIICLARLMDNSPGLICVTFFLALASLGTGIFAVLNAAAGLRARLPPARGKPSVLFPLYPPNKYRQAVRSFNRLTQGLTRTEILHEYELQLVRIGQILHEKAHHLSRSISFFIAQIVLFVVALLLLIVARMWM